MVDPKPASPTTASTRSRAPPKHRRLGGYAAAAQPVRLLPLAARPRRLRGQRRAADRTRKGPEEGRLDAQLLLHLPQPLQRRGHRPVPAGSARQAPPRPTPSSPQLVPKILASPAYKKDGLLIVTFGQANPPPIDPATGAPRPPRRPAESRRPAGLALRHPRLDRRRRLRPLLAAALDRGPLRPRPPRRRPSGAKVKSFAPAAAGRKRRRLSRHSATRFWQAEPMTAPEPGGEPITAAGIEELKAELEQLEGPARQEMAARIKVAREEGDLKENAEYHVAKEDQAHMETRIKRLQERLHNAVVVEVDARPPTSFAFGRSAEVLDEANGETNVWTLVGSTEANLAEGRLSAESPIGRALMDAKVGATVKVETPRGTKSLQGPQARLLAPRPRRNSFVASRRRMCSASAPVHATERVTHERGIDAQRLVGIRRHPADRRRDPQHHLRHRRDRRLEVLHRKRHLHPQRPAHLGLDHC